MSQCSRTRISSVVLAIRDSRTAKRTHDDIHLFTHRRIASDA